MIGAYYRLTLADEDKDILKKESNSIANQKELIRGFLKRQADLCDIPIREFIDDGYSGTSTHRPAFEEMMECVKKGQVKTIIVKDFSRFARDYIEAGDYIERIFPFMGIRFIAVNDHYDSNTVARGSIKDMEMVIKNIVNAAYSRDLSAKIAATNKTKRNKNLYLGGYRPFGFLPDPEDCHKLILDPVASVYVRRVFDFALEGKSTRQIATALNKEEIPTSGTYFAATDQVKAGATCWNLKGAKWTVEKVCYILRNQKYKGTFVAQKVVQTAPCSHTQVKNDPDKVIYEENAHVGIVTPEEFELAQNAIRTVKRSGERNKRNYLLRGKVLCGYCRRMMSHYERLRDGEVYFCRYSKSSEDSECTGKPISSEILQSALRSAFTQYYLLLSTATEQIQQRNLWLANRKTELETEQAGLQEQKSQIVMDRAALYESYAEEEITKEAFLTQKPELEKQEQAIMQQLAEVRKKLTELSHRGEREYTELLEKSTVVEQTRLENLSIPMIEEFLERMEVYNGERVEFVWKFRDEMQELLLPMEGLNDEK